MNDQSQALPSSEAASFGGWVRARRLACELTQAALGQQVGCAPITIRKIEANVLRPSTHLQALLQTYLTAPPGPLLGPDPPPRRPRHTPPILYKFD